MRNKLYFAIYFIFPFVIGACNNGNNQKINTSYDYELKVNEKQLNYLLDNKTRYHIKAMSVYVDKNGHEFLTFQNDTENEILFYDMNSMEFLFRLDIDMEGPDGVGLFVGYYIDDLNNIYLTPASRTELIVIDTTSTIRRKIDYSKTNSGINLVPSQAISFVYTPMVFINNEIYITQSFPNFEFPFDKTPVSVKINMANESIEALPLYAPHIMDKKDIDFAIGPEFAFSRSYDGSQFIYSYFFDENINVASIDHKLVQKIAIKSKYIKTPPKTEKRPNDMILGIKKICEIPMYGNLIYDKYRDVYYRIAYPETEMEPNENYAEIWQAGRKKFSIIILDKNFNIIGETLFPEYRYISTIMFVNEDGLYISNSHYKNPDFDEDKLSFTCFSLVKN